MQLQHSRPVRDTIFQYFVPYFKFFMGLIISQGERINTGIQTVAFRRFDLLYMVSAEAQRPTGAFPLFIYREHIDLFPFLMAKGSIPGHNIFIRKYRKHCTGDLLTGLSICLRDRDVPLRREIRVCHLDHIFPGIVLIYLKLQVFSKYISIPESFPVIGRIHFSQIVSAVGQLGGCFNVPLCISGKFRHMVSRGIGHQKVHDLFFFIQNLEGCPLGDHAARLCVSLSDPDA